MTEQKCNDGHASYINQVAVLLIHDIHDSIFFKSIEKGN